MAAPATGPAAEYTCPPTHCPGPGPGLPSRGDSRREALLGAASAPRPRRRIHSPALVPKAEAPRLLRYVCCTRDTLRLELGGPCRAPQGSPPHPEPAASPTCAPGSPEALCLAGPLCPGLWMVVGERSLSPTKYHDQNCCRKAPLSSTAPPHPEFFAAQPTLFYFFFFSCRILEAHFLALGPFSIIWGLGNKAWPLSTQSDPAWRGRAGTTSFSTSRSVESRLTLGQASPVESPAGDPTPSHTSLLPQGGSRCPPLPPSQAPHGAGPVPCGRRVGMALGHPCPSPAESSICLCLGRGGRGGSPCGFLSLVGMAQRGQALTVSTGCPLPSQCPATPASCCPARSGAPHGALLSAGTAFPFPHLLIPGKRGSGRDMRSIQDTAHPSLPL